MSTTLALSPTLNFKNLTFTDCKAVANFTSLYFWGSRENFIKTYDALYWYILYSLPSGVDRPSKNEVMTWFYQNYKTDEVTRNMYQIPFDNCRAQTCQKIDYPGNADIAGIGMLAAYVIEGVMATMFLTAKVLPMIKQHTTTPILQRRPAVQWSWADIKYRYMNAILFSMDDFMDTATLFCFTIIIAGLITIPSTKKPYDMLQAILVTAFSLSVILAIWPFQKESMRREVFRNIFFAFTIVLAFIEAASIFWTGTDTDNITRKEVNCLNEIFPSFHKPSKFFIVIQAFTGGAVLLVLLLMIFTIVPLPEKINKKALSDIGKWIVCIYGFVSLWLTLGSLIWIRYLVKHKIGISGPERTWGFGQVMALATWVPVIIFMGEIFIFGADKALKSRIAPPWKVFSDAETYVIVGKNKKKGSLNEMQVVSMRRLHSRAPRLISEPGAENGELSD